MVQRRVSIVAVIVVVAAALALLIRPPLREPGLSHELIAMQREVDEVRVGFGGRDGGSFSISDLPEEIRDRFEEQRDLDLEHQNRLRPMLERHGWPSERDVGREARHAALQIVLRAPDLSFKEFAIGLMKRAGADDNPDYARLVDMIAVNKGERQTYGTMWTCEDGYAKPITPIRDPERALRLRRQVGLEPYEKFGSEFCARGFDPVQPPPGLVGVQP